MIVRDLGGERGKQEEFWTEWLGGRPIYTENHACSRLQQRHSQMADPSWNMEPT